MLNLKFCVKFKKWKQHTPSHNWVDQVSLIDWLVSAENSPAMNSEELQVFCKTSLSFRIASRFIPWKATFLCNICDIGFSIWRSVGLTRLYKKGLFHPLSHSDKGIHPPPPIFLPSLSWFSTWIKTVFFSLGSIRNVLFFGCLLSFFF